MLYLNFKQSSIRVEKGFTLVELLVATSVLALMLGLMLNVTNLASSTVTKASAKIDAFAAGRSAFDIMTQRLSQARLNTYWDYYNSAGVVRNANNSASFVAKTYGRASNLQFFVCPNTQINKRGRPSGCGQEVYFQAPEAYSTNSNYQSTQGLLNGCGYYVRFGSDAAFRPDATSKKIPLRYRYRLMQAMESTEKLQIFAPGAYTVDGATNVPVWAEQLSQTKADDSASPSKPLADNVIAMIVWPRDPGDTGGNSLTANYAYDSQASPAPPQGITVHQLPPTVQVTLVLIDEGSAARLDRGSDTPPDEISDALEGKFAISTVTAFNNDLQQLATSLAAHHINYQILNTSVVLRESKWSK